MTLATSQSPPNFKQSEVIYQSLSAIFCTLVLLSNIISAKLVPLPLFKMYTFPAGLLTYPLTFWINTLVIELFGTLKARRMVYVTLGMNVLAFLILKLALQLPSASAESQEAFQNVMGLSGLRIFSSLLAYFIAHFVVIKAYGLMGRASLWLRSNSAIWVSQLLDTLIIDLLFLYGGLKMPLKNVLPIMLFSFLYKMLFSAATTPFSYLFFSLWRRFSKAKAIGER